MKTLTRTLAAERIKVKHTAAGWLIVIAAAFLPLMQLFSYWHTNGQIRLDPGENPWVSFWQNSFALGSVFIIPMFVVLSVGLMMEIEYKSHTWKHLLVLPLSKQYWFVSKFLLIIGMLLSFYGLFLLLVIVDAWFLTTFIPEANPGHLSPDWTSLAALTGQSLITVLPMMALHVGLAFRIKNLVVQMGLGLIGIITGLVLASPGTWEGAFYYPYALPALLAYRLNPAYHYPDYPANLYGLAYFGLLGVLSYWDFKKHFKG